MAEPIEMPFGGQTHVAKEPRIRWDPNSPRDGSEGALLTVEGEMCPPTVKYLHNCTGHVLLSSLTNVPSKHTWQNAFTAARTDDGCVTF